MSKFKTKSGRELHIWEVPLEEYLAEEMPGKPRRRAWHTHLLAVAQALRDGKRVPERVLSAYGADVVAQADLEVASLRGDASASAALRAQAIAEGRSTVEWPQVYLAEMPGERAETAEAQPVGREP